MFHKASVTCKSVLTQRGRSKALSVECDALVVRVKTLEAQLAEFEAERTGLQGDVCALHSVQAVLKEEVQVGWELSSSAALTT